MKKIIPISHLAIDRHEENLVNPVDIQQMIEQALDFWNELDRNMARLNLENLNDTE